MDDNDEAGGVERAETDSVLGKLGDDWQAYYRMAIMEAAGWDQRVVDAVLAATGLAARRDGGLPGDPDRHEHIETTMRAHVRIARRLARLIGGMTVEINREPAATDAPPDRSPVAQEALQIGRAVQRSIQRSIEECWAAGTRTLIEEIRGLFNEHAASGIRSNTRWLNTEDMAKRLRLAPKTVRKFCGRGLIDAQKTASGEWRTTEARLQASKYLTVGKRRRRPTGEGS